MPADSSLSTPSIAEGRPADIRGIRPAIVGMYATHHCPDCGHEWEMYQPTVLGLAFSQLACPKCSVKSYVDPDIWSAAMERLRPESTVEEMVSLTQESSRLAESWYRSPSFDAVLRHRDVSLGEAAERFLLSYFTLGLESSDRAQEETH